VSTFIVENGQLLVIAPNGSVTWKGNPKGKMVAKVLPLPDGNSAVVLFDYYRWNEGASLNLACVDEGGEVIWQSSDKTGQFSEDPFTDAAFEDRALFATTWGGKRCSVELSDGSITYSTFTK
jgi:hypothetical protein